MQFPWPYSWFWWVVIIMGLFQTGSLIVSIRDKAAYILSSPQTGGVHIVTVVMGSTLTRWNSWLQRESRSFCFHMAKLLNKEGKKIYFPLHIPVDLSSKCQCAVWKATTGLHEYITKLQVIVHIEATLIVGHQTMSTEPTLSVARHKYTTKILDL